MSAPASVSSAAAAPAPLKGDSASTYFQLFNDEPAIPEANELLSLKILKDANPDAFASIAADETKWLAVAFGLLKRDPYLQVQMKGRGVRQAMKLANLLKQKAEERHFVNRIDNVVNKMVNARFKETGWQQMGPIDDETVGTFLEEVTLDNKDIVMNVNPNARGNFTYGGNKKLNSQYR